jgi:hypothetical protein
VKAEPLAEPNAKFLPAGEIVSPYPVEVQNNVKGDKSDKYGTAGFVKKAEGLK